MPKGHIWGIQPGKSALKFSVCNLLQYTSRAAQLYRQQLAKDAAKLSAVPKPNAISDSAPAPPPAAPEPASNGAAAAAPAPAENGNAATAEAPAPAASAASAPGEKLLLAGVGSAADGCSSASSTCSLPPFERDWHSVDISVNGSLCQWVKLLSCPDPLITSLPQALIVAWVLTVMVATHSVPTVLIPAPGPMLNRRATAI